jgi:hypothetical protein
MLPTFLGIGVPKAATTWLHELLASHPDVWMPERRKELQFFSQHYERGEEWYETFFPPEAQADRYRALGEVTPSYLFAGPACAARIAQIPSIRKLVLIVRHPIDRAYSAYAHRVRTHNYHGDFEAFAADFPYEVAWGEYAHYLEAYLRHFRREQMLVLVFERIFDDVERTKRALARFLDLDVARFPSEAGRAVVNPTFIPRFRTAFALAQKGLNWLHDGPGRPLLRGLRRLGVVSLGRRLLGKQSKSEALPPMAPATRCRLARRYADDVERLEALTGLDLAIWKTALP